MMVVNSQKKNDGSKLYNQSSFNASCTCMLDVQVFYDTIVHKQVLSIKVGKDHQIKEATSSLDSIVLELEYLDDHAPEAGAKQAPLLRQEA